MNNLNQAISDYEHLFIGICELSKKYKIPNKEIRKALEDKGYYLGKGVSPKSVVHIKLAVEEYKNIITKYDTVSTPLITDGEASRNDNDTFRKNILLTQILSKHGKN